MSTLAAVLMGVGILVGGVVIGWLAWKVDDPFTDEDYKNFVFRNEFRRQLRDRFNNKK